MNKLYEILGVFFIVLVGWFGLMKGIEYYNHYTLIKNQKEKIEFLEKNNAPIEDKCGAVKAGINFAANFQDQQALDEFNKQFKTLSC